jgi:conjugative transfer pilus assembly protein TraH
MKNPIRTKLAVVVPLILGLVIWPGPLRTLSAGWVDDWFDQHTSTDAGYYEGQKRGYYTAGGFSGRVKLSNDSLVTVMPPKLKSGCGGIDVFWGGFSFLNFDYLVQKSQRILQSAPYAAFDIALNTLCTPCAQTIKSIDAIANQLNTLQLDDCKASRAVATYPLSLFSQQGKEADLGAVKSDFMTSAGMDNLWDNIKKSGKEIGQAWSSPPTNFVTSTTNSPVKSCPNSIKTLLGEEGSLLQRIGSRIGLTDEFIAIMRGLIGDVYISPINGITVTPVPHCSENNSVKAADLTASGAIYIRGNAGTEPQLCEPYTGLTLQQMTQLRMERIITSMMNRTPLSPEDDNYLNQTPLSLGLILKTAVMMGAQDEVVMSIPDLVARAYAYLMLNDMIAHIEYAIAKAQQTVAAQKTGESIPEECNLQIFNDSIGSFDELRSRGRHFAAQLQVEYQKILNERATLQQWVNRYESFNKLAHNEVQQRFGLSVANRAMGIW